jgi:hypothetical protein
VNNSFRNTGGGEGMNNGTDNIESVLFLKKSSLLETHPESFDKCNKGIQHMISIPLSFNIT